MTTVLIKKLDHAVDAPLSYATPGSAGFDLRAAVTDSYTLAPGETAVIPTGFSMEVPSGYEAQIRSRSGLSLKGVMVANSPGTIDSDYRGEVGILLRNAGSTPFIVQRGDRIAQMVIARYEQVQLDFTQDLSDTERGEGGFGSSGVK